MLPKFQTLLITFSQIQYLFKSLFPL